jgi:hypothetical protein
MDTSQHHPDQPQHGERLPGPAAFGSSSHQMNTMAVVLEQPERLVLSRLPLSQPSEDDVVVDIAWSGI